eukprot:1161222-Pelagomonas_calceolata.AAC.14
MDVQTQGSHPGSIHHPNGSVSAVCEMKGLHQPKDEPCRVHYLSCPMGKGAHEQCRESSTFNVQRNPF